MSMFDPNKVMEAWLNLVTEAVRGNNDARETVRSLTGVQLRPDEMLRVMSRFMPAGMMPVPAETLNESLEEYWKTMGVVPRYRYLELLERHERLRERLEELEQTNRQMSPLAAQPEEAKRVLNLWGTMLEESMKFQQEMLNSWSPNVNTRAESSDANATKDVGSTQSNQQSTQSGSSQEKSSG